MTKEFTALKAEFESKMCPVSNKSSRITITPEHRICGEFCCESFLNKHEHFIDELQEIYTWCIAEKSLFEFLKIKKLPFEN